MREKVPGSAATEDGASLAGEELTGSREHVEAMTRRSKSV